MQICVRTCSACVISNGEGVTVILRINREQSNPKHAILCKRCAVLKIFKIYAQFIVSLDRQSMDLF